MPTLHQKGSDLAETLPKIVPVAREGKVSEKDAADYFMDLAFAEGRTRLSRFPFYDPGTHPKNTISIVNAGERDRLLVRSFILMFNQLSETNQFSDVVLSDQDSDIVIQFVPAEGMGAIPVEAYVFEIQENGVSCLRVGEKKIYVNNDLTGDKRSYAIVRGILYRLGLKGEDLLHADSIFSLKNTADYHMSQLDARALGLLYSKKLSPGMHIDDVRDIVYSSI
jgi:hypothetical protein